MTRHAACSCGQLHLTIEGEPSRNAMCHWENAGFPALVSVAIGNFADPSFPAPAMAVWEESRHSWVNLPPDIPPKRAVKQG
jgi:hypothetical protein